MALDGVIFDLDGTLVDSNRLHVEAWRRAFQTKGYRVAADRIFIEVGKGGDKVIPHLLGQEADEKDGDALRDAQPKEFAGLVQTQGLKAFPGAEALIAEARRRGLKTVLATSSDNSQLDIAESGSGVKWRKLTDYLVTNSDVKESKPAPDLVAAAVKKLGLTPAQCVMIGDTPYDAEASRDAGVVCIGLTCGGHSAETLVASGARAVWEGAADLLGHFDEALAQSSPGAAHLTRSVLEGLMREALSAAKEGMANGEVPIGAVLSRGDGLVIAHGFNQLNRTGNRTAHAEIVAFARAAGKMSPDARDTILVSTLEPCVMCLGAAMVASVDTIIYGLRAPADRGTGRVKPPSSPESQMPRIVGDVLASESRALFQQWLDRPDRNPSQETFVRQLLELTKA